MLFRFVTSLTILSVLLTPFGLDFQLSDIGHQHHAMGKIIEASIDSEHSGHQGSEVYNNHHEGFTCTENEEDEKEETESDEFISHRDQKVDCFPLSEPFLFSFQNLNLINFPEQVWRPPQNILS